MRDVPMDNARPVAHCVDHKRRIARFGISGHTRRHQQLVLQDQCGPSAEPGNRDAELATLHQDFIHFVDLRSLLAEVSEMAAPVTHSGRAIRRGKFQAGVSRTSLSEADLVRKFRKTGESRWFEALYLQTRRRAFGIALHYLREPGRAEDVCHDAFVRAFECFDSMTGDNFSAWLGRIVTNLALNALRDRINHERLLAEREDTHSVAPAAESEAAAREELDRVIRIIADLSPPQRCCLLFRQFDGLSNRQISALTGFSDNEVRSHIQNARRNLRIALGAGSEATAND